MWGSVSRRGSDECAIGQTKHLSSLSSPRRKGREDLTVPSLERSPLRKRQASRSPKVGEFSQLDVSEDHLDSLGCSMEFLILRQDEERQWRGAREEHYATNNKQRADELLSERRRIMQEEQRQLSYESDLQRSKREHIQKRMDAQLLSISRLEEEQGAKMSQMQRLALEEQHLRDQEAGRQYLREDSMRQQFASKMGDEISKNRSRRQQHAEDVDRQKKKLEMDFALQAKQERERLEAVRERQRQEQERVYKASQEWLHGTAAGNMEANLNQRMTSHFNRQMITTEQQRKAGNQYLAKKEQERRVARVNNDLRKRMEETQSRQQAHNTVSDIYARSWNNKVK